MPLAIHTDIPAMLLAAGRGERMRPLTDVTPKPLLLVRGKSLLAWRLQALQRDGLRRVIINTAWLGEHIEATLGTAFPATAPPASALQIRYSHEAQDFGHALETAGGIVRALPLLGDLFWVMAGDVYAPDFIFDAAAVAQFRRSNCLAHIWLVPNPEHHPAGDFCLDRDRGLAFEAPPGEMLPRHTYSTIGLFRRELFLPAWCPLPEGNPQGERYALAPLLRAAMRVGLVRAALYTGAWTDVGTPARLATLNADT